MTPAERTVLTALVRLCEQTGRATVTQVAESAGLGRSTTYGLLRGLRETGLVSMGDAGGLRPVGVVLIGGELYQATRLTCGNDGEHEFDEGRMGSNESGPGAVDAAPRPLATGPVQEDR